MLYALTDCFSFILSYLIRNITQFHHVKAIIIAWVEETSTAARSHVEQIRMN